MKVIQSTTPETERVVIPATIPTEEIKNENPRETLDHERIKRQEKENSQIESGREDSESIESSEDNELARLLDEVRKTGADYFSSKDKSLGAWERIKKVFPKLKSEPDFSRVEKAEKDFDKYIESRNKMVEQQEKEFKNRKSEKSFGDYMKARDELVKQQEADLEKIINPEKEKTKEKNRQGANNVKEIDEYFKRYTDAKKKLLEYQEEKMKKKIKNIGGKKEKQYNSIEDAESGEIADSEKKDKMEEKMKELLKKYNMSDVDSLDQQMNVFVDQLVKNDISKGKLELWKDMKEKRKIDLVGKNSENIQKLEKYFKNILGEKAEFGENETVNQWVVKIVRIIKESLEANK